MKSWAIIVAIALLVFSGVQGYRIGYKASEAKHQVEFAKQVVANSDKQKALFKGIEKVAEDAEKEQIDLERRLAGADLAIVRLQQTIRDANSRANSSTAADADAERARALLADCAIEYRNVAGQADQLRATVLGLQAYARRVSE